MTQQAIEEFFKADWLTIEEILISFFLGALIGLEREKARLSKPLRGEEKEFPGVRSFGLTCMYGATMIRLLTLVGEEGIPNVALYISIIGLLMFPVILGFYIAFRFFVLRISGITTILALAFTFFIGILVGANLILEAAAITVFITFILAIKPEIQKFVTGISYRELLSALEVGIVVFVFSPLLLMDIYDPIFRVFNFRILYVFFALTLVLSLLSYVAVRVMGAKALTYFAFFGGLVNSESTVLNLVRLGLKVEDKIRDWIVAGVLLANTSMILRNLILAASLTTISGGAYAEIVIAKILIGMLPSMLIGYAAALVYSGKKLEKGESLTLESPLSFKVALKAAIVYAGIFVFTKVLSDMVGSAGIILSATLGGFINAGATILSIYTIATISGETANIAGASVLLATFSAIMNKIVFTRMGGAKSELIKKVFIYLLLLAMPCLTVGLLMTFNLI
ncbi:MAG: hypothetical protein DRJ38_02790 [Thermoprotei archaeon]|nr:MAG: hypothetical protein DRJ38_02790 [Thermoprotei archaeon]